MSTKLRYLYRAYRYRFRVDRAELRFVREVLRPGQVAVDIGCHKGAYTYWMRRHVGPTGKVFAFEPQPRQVAYLQKVFASLPFNNITLVPMALSDHVGQATLHIPNGAGQTHAASLESKCRGPSRTAGWTSPTNSLPQIEVGNAHPTALEQGARSKEQGARGSESYSLLSDLCSPLSVDTTTLDAFFAGQPRGPDFIKIDVEGHELSVLQGGRNSLERHRPKLLIECEARHRADGDVRPVFDLLSSLGYQGTFFHDGRRRALAEFDPAVHQHIGSNFDGLPHGYVNNFAFLHPNRDRNSVPSCPDSRLKTYW